MSSAQEIGYNLFPNSFNTVSSLDLSMLPAQEWPAQWHASDRFPTPQSAAINLLTESLNEQYSYAPSQQKYHLGSTDLTLAPYREHIVQTIGENQKAVLIGGLGSGKSTNTPLYLLEAGYPRVLVSEPRILAARELMNFARRNVGVNNEHLVGYLTGNADDSDCPETARLIYVTEDLLLRIVNRGLLRPDDTLVIDEAHERNPGAEILLGLMENELSKYPDMRELVTSATIPADDYATYLGGAPVIEIGGRVHPITIQDTTDEVATAMKHHMRKDRNVLAFEPGIGRMRTTWARAQSRMSGHNVHMLHGNLSPREQAEALNSHDANHIVATRVGETSITPENKDVVVDSGLSNLGGYEQGKQILRTVYSSQATMSQRMGRVGRTKPGIYERAVPSDAPPQPAFEDRPAYDPSPIENSSVSNYILELLMQGRRLEQLHLLKRPTEANLAHDYKLLQRLGAIVLAQPDEYEITEVGQGMLDLPVDSSQARMLVEARNYREVNENGEVNESVQLQVAALIAIQQVKGIFDMQNGVRQRYLRRKQHQDGLSNEHTSDALFETDVFIAMFAKQQELLASGRPDAEELFERLLRNTDLLPNRYYKALSTFDELCRREGLNRADLRKPTASERENIITCQIKGAEELFVRQGKATYRDIRGEHGRILGRKSVVAPVIAELVIGKAFNLQGMRRTGRFERRFIFGGTAVTLEQLQKAVPERISRQITGYGVNRKGVLVQNESLFFDTELKFIDVEAPLSPTLDTRAEIIKAMMTGFAPNLYRPSQLVPYNAGTPNATKALRIWNQAQQLDHKSTVDFRTAERYEKLIQNVVRESLRTIPLDVTDPDKLDVAIPAVYLRSLVRPTKSKYLPAVLTQSPDAIVIHTAEDKSEYLPVTYRNQIAHVSVPKGQRFAISEDDFTQLRKNHDVKIRFGAGKYQQLEVAIKELEKDREREQAKQAIKAQRVAETTEVYIRKIKERKYREETEQALQEEVARRVGAIPLRPKGKYRGEARRARKMEAKEAKQ